MYVCMYVCMYETVNAQTALVTQKNPSTVTLSLAEQGRYNTYFDSTGYSSKYLVSIDSIENFFTGNELTINIPLTSTPITFKTNNAISHSNGDIYWTGYSSDLSYFRIGRYAEGTFIDMYIRNLDKKFQIMSVSSEYQVMTVYNDWTDKEETLGCGNIAPDGEDDDVEQVDDDEELEDGETEFLENRAQCDWNNVRILVLFTPGTPNFGDPLIAARMLIDELNTSTSSSSLRGRDIRFSLANTLELQGFIENRLDPRGDVNDLRNSTVAQGLRNDNLADLVILLTRPVYNITAGIAFGINVSANNAFCLATINATMGNMTGSHEIGHLIGCRHQRSSVCDEGDRHDNNIFYPHGFNIGNNSRTIMHALGCNRNRLAFWSNRIVEINGEGMGNFTNDNVKKLKRRAADVACFRQGVPSGTQPPPPPPRFLFYIEGHNILCSDPITPPPYTAIFDANAFPSPTFQWHISVNGLTDWYIPYGLVNNGSSCILPDPSFLPAIFFLRVVITASNSYSENFVMMITQYDDPTGECVLMMRSNQNTTTEKEPNNVKKLENVHISPNPSQSIFNIKGLHGELKLDIFTMEGKLVKTYQIFADGESDFQLQMNDQSQGLYIVKIKNLNTKEEITHKIILQ